MDINVDSLIKLIEERTGLSDSYTTSLYIADAIRNYDEVRNMIAEYVTEDMTNNLEFQDESPQEKRERLEQINNGGN